MCCLGERGLELLERLLSRAYDHRVHVQYLRGLGTVI